MGHALSLGLTLFATWLLLSGHYDAFIVALGVASCVFAVAIARRMDVCDHETHPIHLTVRVIGYWAWLIKEIVKANIDVAKRVLSPRLAISPALIRVKSSQATDLGRVVYANSITLTPGTITVDIEGDEFIVHELDPASSEDIRNHAMENQIQRLCQETHP